MKLKFLKLHFKILICSIKEKEVNNNSHKMQWCSLMVSRVEMIKEFKVAWRILIPSFQNQEKFCLQCFQKEQLLRLHKEPHLLECHLSIILLMFSKWKDLAMILRYQKGKYFLNNKIESLKYKRWRIS